MAVIRTSTSFFFTLALVFVVLPSFCQAFGAGNIQSIARIEGQRFRHGDIEDTLLSLITARCLTGKQFSKMDVRRVYFGNWLRDYSQAIDVGTVKAVSAEAIRLIIWILGFLTFGYGTKEFEVTTDRLECYRPEHHIDNPRGYGGPGVDARQYDPRLRAPVDEPRELSIDPRTGLKNYIASEDLGITTSAGLIRNLFGRCVEHGRSYARSGNKADLYEALRLLGAGCHCLEDYPAHSNYVELCLIEMGERNTFPHVGKNAAVQIRGLPHPVWPIVTGTFGGVDFLHSVMGEFSDRISSTELQQLDNTLGESQNKESSSMVKDLLKQLPPGLLGGQDHGTQAEQLEANATAQQMQQTHITPKKPEAWLRQLQRVQGQLMPILEWHDSIMQSISEAIEKIPVLPELIEKIQDEISLFVYSLIGPYIQPILKQVGAELSFGSEEVIQSSKQAQLIVFNDDNCTDPTHSMLSKDHFSNILNGPAGMVGCEILRWVVPQIMAAWDDPSIDPQRMCERIIYGVFHHPACRTWGNDGAADGRQAMFSVVEKWWGGMSEGERQDFRMRLSRDGVMHGKNHEEGVHDTGHGSCKPLGLPKMSSSSLSSALPGGALAGVVGVAGASLLNEALGQSGGLQSVQQFTGQSVDQHGAHTQTKMETGYSGKHHAQAQHSQTTYPDGGRRDEYSHYEQHGGQGHGYTETTGTYPMGGGGGYAQVHHQQYEGPDGRTSSHQRTDYYGADGGLVSSHSHNRKDSDDDDSGSEDSGGSDNPEKRERKARRKMEKQRRKQEKMMRKGGKGGKDKDSDSDSDKEKRRPRRGSGGGGGGHARRGSGGRGGGGPHMGGGGGGPHFGGPGPMGGGPHRAGGGGGHHEGPGRARGMGEYHPDEYAREPRSDEYEQAGTAAEDEAIRRYRGHERRGGEYPIRDEYEQRRDEYPTRDEYEERPRPARHELYDRGSYSSYDRDGYGREEEIEGEERYAPRQEDYSDYAAQRERFGRGSGGRGEGYGYEDEGRAGERYGYEEPAYEEEEPTYERRDFDEGEGRGDGRGWYEYGEDRRDEYE